MNIGLSALCLLGVLAELTAGFVTPSRSPTSPSWLAPLSSLASSSQDDVLSKAEEEHAREVFAMVDKDKTNDIDQYELSDLLDMLDISADNEECEALFRYLDVDECGKVDVEDFLPWYSSAVEAARSSAEAFQAIICNRRTVGKFDKTPVADDVLRRAIKCAISAPNRSGSEPWRFIQLGAETVAKVADLNRELGGTEGSFMRWTNIPGWCVVTCSLMDDGSDEPHPEDFRSVSCAIQNFMLSMWSEGVGSKWTSGPVQKTAEFAKLCGVDQSKEVVVGVVWYGFARGGLQNTDRKQRQKTVEDVLSSMP